MERFTILPSGFKDKSVWNGEREGWPQVTLDRLPMHIEWIDTLIANASKQDKPVLMCFKDLQAPATYMFAKQSETYGKREMTDPYLPWSKAGEDVCNERGDVVEIGAYNNLIDTCDKWIEQFQRQPDCELYIEWLKNLKSAAVATSSSDLADAVEQSQKTSWKMCKLGLLVMLLSVSDYVTFPNAPETSLLKTGEIELYLGRPVNVLALKDIRRRVKSRSAVKNLPPMREFVLDCLAVAGNGVFSLSSGQIFAKRGGMMMNVNASEVIAPLERMYEHLGLDVDACSVSTNILYPHELFHLVGPRETKRSNPYLTEQKSDAPSVELVLEMALANGQEEVMIHALGMVYSLMADLPKFEAANDESYRLSGLMVMGILCQFGALKWDEKSNRPVVEVDGENIGRAIKSFKRLRKKYFEIKSEGFPRLYNHQDLQKIIAWYVQFK